MIIYIPLQTESRFVKSYKVQMYNPNSPEGGRWETYQDPYGEEKVCIQ